MDTLINTKVCNNLTSFLEWLISDAEAWNTCSFEYFEL